MSEDIETREPRSTPELSSEPSEEEVTEALDWLEDKNRLETAKEMARLKRAAAIDWLTGLRNLGGVMNELVHLRAMAQRNAKEKELSGVELPSLILITEVDLDELKKINTTLGKSAGNKLLRETARALEQSVREADICGRVGGDEFAVLGLVKDLSEKEVIKERIRQRLQEKKVEASMGQTVWEEGEDFSVALDRADFEMLKNKKERGRGRG